MKKIINSLVIDLHPFQHISAQQKKPVECIVFMRNFQSYTKHINTDSISRKVSQNASILRIHASIILHWFVNPA